MPWIDDIDSVDIAELAKDDQAYKTFVVATFKAMKVQCEMYDNNLEELFRRINKLQETVSERVGASVERDKVIEDLKEIAHHNREHIIKLTASVENGLRDRQREMSIILAELKDEIQKLTTQGIVRATKEAESLSGSINEGWKWFRQRLGRFIVMTVIVFFLWAMGKEILFNEKGILHKLVEVISK